METASFGNLVEVLINEVDHAILDRIAKHDNISVAHALTMQFSGYGLYNDWIDSQVGDKVTLKDILL